jgi:hypothetical protein
MVAQFSTGILAHFSISIYNKKLHTFLLNSNNDVIFIGNPLENGRIEDLFEKQIQ